MTIRARSAGRVLVAGAVLLLAGIVLPTWAWADANSASYRLRAGSTNAGGSAALQSTAAQPSIVRAGGSIAEGAATGPAATSSSGFRLTSGLWAIEPSSGAICGDETLDALEECDDGGNVDGDGCSALCRIEQSLTLYGAAQGGEIELLVEGVALVVTTAPGSTLDQIAAQVVSAILEHPSLGGLGIGAVALGNRIVTDATLVVVEIRDPGISIAPPVPTSGPVGAWLGASIVIAWMAARAARGAPRSDA